MGDRGYHQIDNEPESGCASRAGSLSTPDLRHRDLPALSGAFSHLWACLPGDRAPERGRRGGPGSVLLTVGGGTNTDRVCAAPQCTGCCPACQHRVAHKAKHADAAACALCALRPLDRRFGTDTRLDLDSSESSKLADGGWRLRSRPYVDARYRDL